MTQTMRAPPVSVLLPTRNAAHTLTGALESLQLQSDPDYELVVVDDGSTDSSPELLRAAAAEDQRIRVLTRAGPGDLVAALELELCPRFFACSGDAVPPLLLARAPVMLRRRGSNEERAEAVPTLLRVLR